MGTPLINFAAGGVPIPGNQLPAAAINPVARNVVALYPLGNVSPSIYRETRRRAQPACIRPAAASTCTVVRDDQYFGRYSYSGGHNVNPISVRGTDVPGYPTRDDLSTHSAMLSSTRIFSPALDELAARHLVPPRLLLRSAAEPDAAERARVRVRIRERAGQGPPFFNVSGYTPIGGAITGPRNSTQTTFELQDGMSLDARQPFRQGRRRAPAHRDSTCSRRLRRTRSSCSRRRFRRTTPIANLLLGGPVTFYQGLGDFNRGMGLWNAGAYAQDEWRATSA